MVPNQIASLRHDCTGSLGVLHFTGDAPSHNVFFEISHPAPVAASGGGVHLAGHFVPGEAVDIYDLPDRGLTMIFPDRSPCINDLLKASGLTPLARTKAPTDEGPWSVRLMPDGQPPFTMSGTVASRLNENLKLWRRNCE